MSVQKLGFWLTWGVLLAAASGCTTAAGAPATVGAVDAISGEDGVPTGQGAGSLNVASCEQSHGYRSAVRVSVGLTDPKSRAQFHAILADAGYLAQLREAEDAAAADGDEADAGALPDDAAQPTDDAGNIEPEDVAPLVPEPPDHYVIGRDARHDAVLLLENGDLVVASHCPLDRLGQMRRLDYGLATAARLVTLLDHPGDYQLETSRWARPDGIYAERAGFYWRQYVDADLSRPIVGTLSLASKPESLAFGLFGHANVPSTVGDVVHVQKFTLDEKTLAGAHTWQVHDTAALLWDLAEGIAAGELPFVLDILVSDASVKAQVGVYHAFFEALFPEGKKDALGLGASAQGALPGTLKVSRGMWELDLPSSATQE